MESGSTATPKTGVVQDTRPSEGNLSSLYGWILAHAGWLAVIIATLAILLPIIWINPDVALGADTLGHLHRASFMGETIRSYGLIDGIVQSAWMPDWYMGDPTWVYYPPLTVWLLGPLTALVGDVFSAYLLFLVVLFLLFALSIYHIGVQWGHSRNWAVIGTLIAITAPYTMRTFFIEGNLSRGIALVLLPWLLWYSERILVERDIHWTFFGLCLLWAMAILAHSMQAAMFAVIIVIYLVLRAVTNIFIPLRRLTVSALPILLGCGIAAFFLLPAYSGVEIAHVPSLPDIKVEQFSLPFEALLPFSNPPGFLSIGMVALAFGLFIMLSETREYHRALYGAAFFAALFSFGEKTGVYRLLPYNQLLLPERFAAMSSIWLAFVFATSPPGFRKTRFLVAVMVLVLMVDSLPAWQALAKPYNPDGDEAIAAILADQPLSGRVAPLVSPSPTSSHIFYTTRDGERANVYGWALENTPQQYAVRRLLRAAETTPDYVERMLSLWNADYVITNLDDLKLAGFSPAGATQDFSLLGRTSSSAFAQVLPAHQMLIIGENATDWQFAFPFASEGYSDDPGVYEPSYLENFSAIGITRAQPTDIEAALGDWVREGNTLIIDLSGMDQIYEQGYSIFGVRALPLTLDGIYRPSYPEDLRGMPARLNFTTPEGPWVGATYYDADANLISIREDGQVYSLLSWSQVGNGQVYFVGLNLIPLLNQSKETAKALVDYLLQGTEVHRELVLPEVPIRIDTQKPAELTFEYTLEDRTPTVLSMTYFPRWFASIDGESLAVRNHEHLIMLDLPAGAHTVTLTYHPLGTPIAQGGVFISGLFVLLTGMAAALLRRYPLLSYADRQIIFADRVPPDTELAQPAMQEYAPCLACGFKLAQVGTPNVKTYPFNSLDCPICGFSLTKESLTHHEDHLTNFDKRRLFLRWLQTEQISKVGFLQRFGFRLEEAFVDPLEGFNYDDTEISDPVVELAIARGQRHWVNTATFFGLWGASAGRDRIIRVWHQEDTEKFRSLIGHQAAVQCLAFHPSGRWLASGSDDHTVRLWQVRDGQEIAAMRHHLAEVTAVAFSRTGQFLFSGGQDNTIRVWDVKKQRQIRVLRGHQHTVTCLAAMETHFVSGDTSGAVLVWDIDRRSEQKQVLQLPGAVLSLCYDGKTVAAIDNYSELSIWDAQSNQVRKPLRDPVSPITSAAFSEGGRLLAVVAEQIIIYETLSGQKLAMLEPEIAVAKVVFNVDELATIHTDGSLQLWEIKQITHE